MIYKDRYKLTPSHFWSKWPKDYAPRVAHRNGWLIMVENRDRQKVEHHGYAPNGFVYVKDGCHVWECVHSRKVVWAVAVVTDGRFSGHQYYRHDLLNSILEADPVKLVDTVDDTRPPFRPVLERVPK